MPAFHRQNSAATNDAVKVLYGALLVVAIQGSGFVVEYVLNVLSARWMGKFEYGIFSYSWSWIIFLSTVSGCGLDNLCLKNIPAFMTAGDYGRTRAFVAFAVTSRIVLSSSIAVFGITGIWLCKSAVPSYFTVPMILALLSVVPFGLSVSLLHVSRGFYWVNLAYIPRFLAIPLLLILCSTVWFAVFGILLSWSMLFLTLSISAGVALFQLWLVRRGVPTKVARAVAVSDFRLWIGMAWPFFSILVLMTIQNRFDSLIVGAWFTPDKIAEYHAAKRTALLVVSFLAAINALAGPKIAELHSSGEMARLQAVIRKMVPVIFLVATVSSLGIIGFRDDILSLFGFERGEAGNVLMILMVGQFTSALFGPCGLLLMMTGNQTSAAKILGATTVFHVLLSLILLKLYGLTGLATATCITMCLWNFSSWLAGRWKTGVDSSIFSLLRPPPKCLA